MGCDIHLYVETKDALGQWQSADEGEPNPYYDAEDNEGGESEFVIPYERRFYTGRNYGLFAILANVRNGGGFAGIKTGDGYNPIVMPRGIPANVSERVKVESDKWGSDGHSHSWLTLRELLDYDWTQTTQLQGWLSAVEFDQWDGYWRDLGESPRGWAGEIMGVTVNKVSEDTMRSNIQALRTGKTRDEANDAQDKVAWYTCCTWKQYYYQVAQAFLSTTVPRLLKLVQGNYDNVRIVFWFDN